MISRVHSSILQGIDAVACEVELTFPWAGRASLNSSGWRRRPSRKPSCAFRCAAKQRVPLAWAEGYDQPVPADIKKDSCAFDLPIALAACVAGGIFESEKILTIICYSESLHWTAGYARFAVLATAMLAAAQGRKGIILPAENAAEAAVVEGPLQRALTVHRPWARSTLAPGCA